MEAKTPDFDPWNNPRDDEERTGACSINGNGDSEPPDEMSLLYVNIEGVDMDNMTDAEMESLERNVTDFMLGKLGKPITNVSVGAMKLPVEED